MIPISKQERQELEAVGLLKYRRKGRNPQDGNFMVTSKKHRSGAKTIYVAETFEILSFLGKYELLNMITLFPNQYNKLVEDGVIKPENTQEWGHYVKGAIAFIGNDGKCHVRRTSEIMNAIRTKKKD